MKHGNSFVLYNLVYSSGWVLLGICFLISFSHYSLMNIALFMKGDWLPLMSFCLIDAILSKVSKTKFSDKSYDIFLSVLN